MPVHFLIAGLLAALAFASVPEASAADLYGENYYPPSESYVEDEPYPSAPRVYRPRDLYEDPPIQYTDRHAAPYGADRYSQYPRDTYPRDEYRHGDGRYSGDCLARWQVRKQLRHDGWVDIQPINRDHGIVSLRARREETGRVFMLKVDRCSGEIIQARPPFLRSFGEGPHPYSRRNWY